MRIGIIGASSQVGSSLAMHLSLHKGIVPICFVRSEYPAVFFEVVGVEYRLIDFTDIPKLTMQLADLELIIDCSYPSGQLYQIGKEIKKQLTAILGAMPSGIPFIYCSTIMAFGMPDGQKYVKNYWLPRSTYAYIKRIAERTVKNLSAKYSFPAFIFRLGQVHGFLQSVNESYREKLFMNKTIKLEGKPGDLVNIIFIESLAVAVIKAGSKQIEHGTYSLVNYPQWTLQQLYDHYIVYYSFQNKIQFTGGASSGNHSSAMSSLLESANKMRPLFETLILLRIPKLYIKVKGKYRIMNVRRMGGTAVPPDYIDFHLLGINPGRLIEGLDSDPKAVLLKEKETENYYNNQIENYINSSPSVL